MKLQFTVHNSPFTVRYRLTIIREQWLMVNGQCMVNSKWPMVNGSGGVL